MKKTTVLLITFVVSICEASTGFVKVNDPKIPKPVKDASASVYRVVAPAGDNTVISYARGNPFKNNDREYLKYAQVEFCKLTKDKVCPIFDSIGWGTAFTMNSGNDLYSALHIFFESISFKVKSIDAHSRLELIQELQRHQMFFGLVNSQGESMFSPKNSKASPLFLNPDKLLFNDTLKVFNSTFGAVSDFIKIHLRTALPHYLNQAPDKPKIGDVVYTIGFPAETSDGETLLISAGKVVPIKGWEKASETIEDPLERSVMEKTFIFTTADCEKGSSGGPLLNANGEVVGIIIDHVQRTKDSQKVCVAHGNFDQKSLGKIWFGNKSKNQKKSQPGGDLGRLF